MQPKFNRDRLRNETCGRHEANATQAHTPAVGWRKAYLPSHNRLRYYSF